MYVLEDGFVVVHCTISMPKMYDIASQIQLHGNNQIHSGVDDIIRGCSGQVRPCPCGPATMIYMCLQ